jgi:hypothetical protein
MVTANQRQQLQEEGFCIFPEVLSKSELARVRAALDKGVEITRQQLGSTHIQGLDPNAANIRVHNLPAIDPAFTELLTRPDALGAAREILGENILVSNFTANIAMPGSGSMKLHSDQALVVPAPWPHAWAMNIIWCLDDVHEANGATRYLPQSQRFNSIDEVPADAMEKTLPFEAPAGSFIAMEGRLWHTSGANRTANERRRMMFAYYSSDFIRQQMNWSMTLPADVQSAMGDEARALLGLAPTGNTRLGAQITMDQAA